MLSSHVGPACIRQVDRTAHPGSRWCADDAASLHRPIRRQGRLVQPHGVTVGVGACVCPTTQTGPPHELQMQVGLMWRAIKRRAQRFQMVRIALPLAKTAHMNRLAHLGTAWCGDWC